MDKFFEALWPVLVAVFAAIIYFAATQGGWSKPDATAFAAAWVYFMLVVWFAIIAVVLDRPKGPAFDDNVAFAAIAETSFAAFLLTLVAIIPSATEPVLVASILGCFGAMFLVVWVAILFMDSGGVRQLSRKLLLAIALTGGVVADHRWGMAAAGAVLVLVLLLQFAWTAFRWKGIRTGRIPA